MRNLDSNNLIKIETVYGKDLPIFKIVRSQEPWSKTQISIEFNVSNFFQTYQMKDYSKALYVEEYDGIEFAKYGCYNFKYIKPFLKSRSGSYQYDIFKIKYDGRFVSPYIDRSDAKIYNSGPKGDYLNRTNRTWYEND